MGIYLHVLIFAFLFLFVCYFLFRLDADELPVVFAPQLGMCRAFEFRIM